MSNVTSPDVNIIALCIKLDMVSVFLLVKGTNTPVFGLLLERLSMLLVVERNECALCVFLSLSLF